MTLKCSSLEADSNEELVHLNFLKDENEDWTEDYRDIYLDFKKGFGNSFEITGNTLLSLDNLAWG